ncbi:4-hydroxy-3-methylbut-2-en-1-yl diphosphate synthase [Candidatus Cyrtobacter comes]|uniref:4-hydroxy-3-methylbut-2-en-1-yl diphosphate synthase (flavodoxin) n=1 Tax=Candidatus Cyrtobacter comes TaxID=675776 RepID=A0ABU5L7I7_9RICK|nr:flavodoxin-dependent (E)-4-hydroxy-3-methylbut-2-enyl-diphosphate synthase [Candidatus Cyrtobacter comes]MDZ5761769.1 4-hydroxy-3-methylbut-2-en-1-yl diphosphate synthase [Candidatus Cyrtobacter comes]
MRYTVEVGNVKIGGANPVIVQSMTDTPTSDVKATARQILDLFFAGSKIVRVTVNDKEAAAAIPYIRDIVRKEADVPLVGCFHYNGNLLLRNNIDCAQVLDKYRINPGNVGFGTKRDRNFEEILEIAAQNEKPIRIGVNWGSLDQELLSKMMDDNAISKTPLSSSDVMEEAIVASTLISAQKAEEFGIKQNKIIVSAKVSEVQPLIRIYKKLFDKSLYPLHLGLTEAGMGLHAIIQSTAALSILLQQGIGDTIRCSITPKPGSARTEEVTVCNQVLASLGMGAFSPKVISCPGCGRTSGEFFRELSSDVSDFITNSLPALKKKYPGVENLNIAVMGCVVNGPGESKHADIGISLPGAGEDKAAPVFIDGQRKFTLKGKDLSKQFIKVLMSYIEERFGQ